MRRSRALPAVALLACWLGGASPAVAGSADELVAMARARELEHQPDLALRRYMDALAIEPTHEGAYLGLAGLRTKLGDLREAERVYSALLDRRPSSSAGLLGRARVRRMLGRAELAEADLRHAADAEPATLKELATWRGEGGRLPAQLAVWREIQVAAARRGDEALLREARTMVDALTLVVGTADPASAPAFDTPVRRSLAALTRRRGPPR